MLPVQAAGAGDRVLGVYKAGRSPDETKRDEMKGSENERNEKKSRLADSQRTHTPNLQYTQMHLLFIILFGNEFLGNYFRALLALGPISPGAYWP